MQAYYLDPTESTPKIILDPNNKTFEISGISRPENVRECYEPVIDWFEEFERKLKEYNFSSPDDLITFKIQLNYFNSASAKFILDILMEINKLYHAGMQLQIDWYYDEGDDDMKEVGEELSEIVDFKFNYIEEE